ncbi:hypothetical protein M432DRAFT_554465 [Thermoascus aurantiacus ATCC 26904]
MAESPRSGHLLRSLNLPPGTSQYRYQGIKHASQLISLATRHLIEQGHGWTESNKSQFILFSCIPENIFCREIRETDNSILGKSWVCYHKNLEILVVKMTTTVHEEVDQRFDTLMGTKTMQMNVYHRLHFAGRKEVQGSSKAKRPDTSYRPMDLPDGRMPNWPSMVVEAGYSESKSKLEADAKWWLNESNGEVKTALAVSIKKTKKEITIQRWELVAGPTRADPDRTGPDVVQQLVISKRVDQPGATVTNAPLTVPFENVLLRLPQGREGDIEFTANELAIMAEAVWTAQEEKS